MCNPMMLMLSGSLMSGIGAVGSLSAQAQSSKMQAAMSEQAAKEERIAGKLKGDQVMREALRIGGQQRTAAAEGGLAQQGSVTDVSMDTAAEADLDTQTIYWNSGAAQSRRLTEARIHRFNAKSARSAMPFAFMTPILMGAAKYPQSFGLSGY